jgi:hypothetical protein
MARFAEFMTADGYQNLVRINLDRVAFVSEDGTATRLHFSALPDDFVEVLDFHGHLEGEDNA